MARVKAKPKPAPKLKQAPKPKKVAIGGKLKPKKSTGRKAYS